MFGCMNLAVDAQDFLGAWNADVVDRLEAEVSESGAQPRGGGQGEPDAGGAAVQIRV